MAPKPPVSETGYMSEWMGFGSTYIDSLETVPAVMWPASVATYSKMRTDAQLTAVLGAYTLPLRQAPKHVDPAGCKDEVAQMVADDLGLPILGEDKEPGPARRRGLEFDDHFRLALLELVFGHMVFEITYELREGKARLANLAERMPSTFTDILTTEQGALDGVLQFGAKSPLPARNLVWYSHEREGAAWQGRSLLRAAYGPWLLKHEMMRVLATGNRRFSMGIPVVHAPIGATPGQILEAQRLASEARVGEQSGAGLPPGFTMELVGLTGGAPDTLEYIKYLDNQMAKMALAGALELDSSPNGSRALGESFINLMLTALNAIGQEISGPLTKLSTQIVDYNFGEDENVPRIVVGDAGSRPEVTAEALQLLMNSGALTADPELDRWVRERWSLPERDPDAPKPGMPLQLVPGQDPSQPPAALDGPGGPDAPPPPPVPAEKATARPGRRTRRRVRAMDTSWRPLTEIEAKSGMIPDQIQGDWESALDRLVRNWTKLEKASRADLLTQISAAVDDDDPSQMGKLTVDTTGTAAILAQTMEDLANESADRMLEEASSQGVPVDLPTVDVTRFPDVAAAVAGIVAGGTTNAAGREALRVMAPGRGGPAVAGLVGAHLESFSDAWLLEQLGGALSTAQNSGRFDALAAAPAARLYSSEVLDRNTCEPCEEIDGTEFSSESAAMLAYGSGPYVECLGRLRCRGIVVATWE
jgi:Protein of unknown function (DUF935)